MRRSLCGGKRLDAQSPAGPDKGFDVPLLFSSLVDALETFL